MSHEGKDKLNEILGGLLTSYQGLQALAEAQRDEFMADVTDETGRIDLFKLAARAECLRASRQGQPVEQRGPQYMSREQAQEVLNKLTWPGKQEIVYPQEMAAALRSALQGFGAEGVFIPMDRLDLLRTGLQSGFDEFGNTTKGAECRAGLDYLKNFKLPDVLGREQVKAKSPYELEPVDFVNNPHHRKQILEGLEGFLKLDHTMDNNPVADGPAEAAKAWIRQVMEWAICNKGYQEQIEGFASSTEETNVAEKIGRGLTKPQVTYDSEVHHVKQLIENVTAAMEQVCDHSYDVGLGRVKEYLEQQLSALTTPRHNVKPVLELKQIAEIMRDWIVEESLASHVKFDMDNMVKSLEAIIAKHIGEDVQVAVDGQMVTESRTVHSLGAVLEASADHTHPLDISQTALKEVALWLNSVIANNPGFHNLGKEGYIVVPSAANVPGAAIDAVRGYLVAYGQGDHSASQLRSQAALAGDLAVGNMPEWFATTYGHVSKGGFAALMYHTLLEVAANPDQKPVYIGAGEMGKLEEQIRNGNPQALVEHIRNITGK